MRKYLAAAIALAAFGLIGGGCAQMQALGSGFELATASINNPVTKSREAQVALALHTAIDVLNTYKAACAQGTADKNCKTNIAQIQAYTRDVKPLVAQLRTFVDSNDQINAAAVYNQLVALYANAKTFAATAGVNLGEIKS
jgi:hypothetical protein